VHAFGDLPDDMEPEAANAIKSARVLLRAVEAGPADAKAEGDGNNAQQQQGGGGVRLSEQLLGTIAAANPSVFPVNGAGSGNTPLGPADAILGSRDANPARGTPASRGAMPRYRPTRGAVSQLPPEDDAAVRLELTAIEGALALLAAGGAHPLHLDVHAATTLAWSRYLLLRDEPAAAVAGQQMRAFYGCVYGLCPGHPMAGLHEFALGDVYSELAGVAAGLVGSAGRRPSAAANPVRLFSAERADALAAIYRSPEAAAAARLLEQPLSAASVGALRDGALARYASAEASLGNWLGRGHPMVAGARKQAASVRSVTAGVAPAQAQQ
jgi:hypothetical protein